VYSITDFSQFKVIYGFNPLTPLDLIHLPVDKRVSLDGNKNTQMVKALYENVRKHIEKKKKNDQYASKINKGHKHVFFPTR
jgi:hypothetical protein